MGPHESIVSSSSSHPTEDTTIMGVVNSRSKNSSTAAAATAANRTEYSAVAGNDDSSSNLHEDEELVDEEAVDAKRRRVVGTFRNENGRTSSSSSSSRNTLHAFCCAGMALYLWIVVVTLFIVIAVLGSRLRQLAQSNNSAATASSICQPNENTAGTFTSSTSTSTSTSTSLYTVTYDPTVAALPWNPFDLQAVDQHGAAGSSSVLSPPIGPIYYDTQDDGQDATNSNNDTASTSSSSSSTSSILGYMMQPDVVNGTMVFVSDGNLFWTRLSDHEPANTAITFASIRLTTTVGNVRSPKINPLYPYWIAFTATYQNRRDVYVMDLRLVGNANITSSNSGGNRPVQRLTYVDSAYGVSGLAGWSADGMRLTYSAVSTAVSLRDTRLYEIAIQSSPRSISGIPIPFLPVLETRPVPLAQATEGVWIPPALYTNEYSDADCLVFVRYKQGSHTARYVGGTAEQLWAYCNDETNAVPLTSDYPGTSKHPTIYVVDQPGEAKQVYLLFLSDRSPMDEQQPIGPTVFHSNDKKWRATSMNLWAAPLPSYTDLYGSSSAPSQPVTLHPIQLTRVSCQFDGMALQEYAVDASTGHVVLRIGADAYHLDASDIKALLQAKDSVPIPKPSQIPIQVVSDFHEQQERLIKIDMLRHLTRADVFETDFGVLSTLLTIRGQVWVAPVLPEPWATATGTAFHYQGSGENIPHRRYRVVPGSMTGGSVRVLAALHVPLFAPATNATTRASSRRMSLVLATDPLSPTAEHAFYMVEVQADSANSFTDMRHLPAPFLGGHVSGGSTKDGGLGSVKGHSVVVSPCGRRFAWTDTDDRICVMTLPIYNHSSSPASDYHCLSRSNNVGEPMAGTLSTLTWSPCGRYLGIEHNALNQFGVISIADCGDPEPSPDAPTLVRDIEIGRISQVTSSRFNSYGLYWGTSSFDMFLSSVVKSLGLPLVDVPTTTLYFLSDRDVVTDVASPWGSRAPMPHFQSSESYVYALPLPVKQADDDAIDPLSGRFPGGGTLEVFQGDLNAYEDAVKSASGSPPLESNDPRQRNLRAFVYAKLSDTLHGRKLSHQEERAVVRYLKAADSIVVPLNVTAPSPFRNDPELALPSIDDLTLTSKAYRMVRIPKARYSAIASQTQDDGSLVVIENENSPLGASPQYRVQFFSANPFPSDVLDAVAIPGVSSWGLSTSRRHLHFMASKTGKTVAIPNTASGLAAFYRDATWSQMVVDTANLAVSVWPALEYRSIYGDAWRLMRDYFYDSNMHSVDWTAVYGRYEPLVQRCGKREELDDVLGQMAAETSALHSFVYGGEYSSPEQSPLLPATLGAGLQRSQEWKGYMVTEIPERDPDFDIVDGNAQYCPISEQTLQPTGQKGLKVGDVIVAINGESVLTAPDINMLLRGTAGRSVRLDVLRLQSGKNIGRTTVNPEPVIVVPIGMLEADDLRYSSWEWKTAKLAKDLAKKSGFSVGYVHMQAMDPYGEDAFARGFFPDYDKDGLVIDVRHNLGGNIDSWIVTMLQRKGWMYWAGRAGDKRNSDLDWNEQFAFRGKIVVLVDELTSSDGEGVARGISELGLGKIIGMRTWGGGIWGSSANKLVDGGIAAAPQWGIFNEKLGWGGGIEMIGVTPDIEVDNDPRETFDGRDMQLERAISELKTWLKKEPMQPYQVPAGGRPDMSLHSDDCPAR